MFCRNCGKELIGTPEICVNCGARPLAGKSYCPACGKQTNTLAAICINCGAKLESAAQPATKDGVAISAKSRLAATLLALFLGEFGAHRFYTGKTATAIVMLVLAVLGYATMIVVIGFFFLTAVGIWNLIDFIMIVAGKFKDSQGNVIDRW